MTQTIARPKAAETIEQVIEQLDDMIDASVAHHDYLFLFTYVYRETTMEVRRAIESKRFDDPSRMEKMDVIFANLFIDAYYQYKIGQEIFGCWKYSFESRKEKLAFVQHILLGMNAHINLDLSLAAAQVNGGTKIITLKNDFMIINQILAELTNKIQIRIGRISFMMKILDIFGFRNDEKIINFSIRKARDFAWINAMELALLDPAQRADRAHEIDLRILEISKLVKNPPGRFLSIVMKIIAFFEIKKPSRIIEKLQKNQ